MDEFIESCLNETKVNPYTKLESPHPTTQFYNIEQLMVSLYPLITFKLMDTGGRMYCTDLPVFLTPRPPRGGVEKRCLAIFNQGKLISIDKYRYVMQFEFLPKLQSFLDERETKFHVILDKFHDIRPIWRGNARRSLSEKFSDIGPGWKSAPSFNEVKSILEDYFNETFDTDPRDTSGGPYIESWKSYLEKKLNYRYNQRYYMDKFTKISHDLPMENIQSYLMAIEGEEGGDDDL